VKKSCNHFGGIFIYLTHQASYPVSAFYRLIVFVLIATSFSSCRVVYRTLLGVDMTPGWKTDQQIEKDIKKRKILEGQAYVLDTASYYNLVVSKVREDLAVLELDSSEAGKVAYKARGKLAKDNLQPTQVRYFDRNGNAIFKLVNCYIDPPIPMRWNVEGCFDAFPPQIDIPELNQGNQSLDYFLPHIKTLNGESVVQADLPLSDYYGIVFWNDFMIRPSKKLIKTLRRYDQDHTGQTTTFLYVNNHNAEIWTKMDAENRRKVLEYLEEKD